MFDVVIVMDVLEHVENAKKAIREAYRVLKKRGTIHLCVPCEANRFTLFWLLSKIRVGTNLTWRHFGHVQKFSTTEVMCLLSKSGFTITYCSFSHHLLSQIIGMLDWYLPKELLLLVFGEETARNCKDCVHMDESVRHSLEMGVLYLIKRVWLRVASLTGMISFWESKILRNKKFTAMTIHVTAQKR